MLAVQVKLREMKPGMLSHELKEALGMPEGSPPPWLINMQVKSVSWNVYVVLLCSQSLQFHLFSFFRDMVLHHHTLLWRSPAWMLPFPQELVLVIILVAGASLPLMRYIFFIFFIFYICSSLCKIIIMGIWIFVFMKGLSTPPHPLFSLHWLLYLSASWAVRASTLWRCFWCPSARSA